MSDFGKAGGKVDAPTKDPIESGTPKVGFDEAPNQMVHQPIERATFAGTTPPAR